MYKKKNQQPWYIIFDILVYIVVAVGIRILLLCVLHIIIVICRTFIMFCTYILYAHTTSRTHYVTKTKTKQ